MYGDIVAAARWLGGSILLASVVLVGGVRLAQPADRFRQVEPGTSPSVPATSGQPAQLEGSVIRGTADSTDGAIPTIRPGVEVCQSSELSQRISILDPNPNGSAPATCMDSPSQAEVWEKLSRSMADSSSLVEDQRSNARIQVEKIGEKVDPCKVYPLAGPCELVHCHYKCTVSFDESRRVDYPVPSNHVAHRVEVVFLDKDYLRRCGGPSNSTAAP